MRFGVRLSFLTLRHCRAEAREQAWVEMSVAFPPVDHEAVARINLVGEYPPMCDSADAQAELNLVWLCLWLIIGNLAEVEPQISTSLWDEVECDDDEHPCRVAMLADPKRFRRDYLTDVPGLPNLDEPVALLDFAAEYLRGFLSSDAATSSLYNSIAAWYARTVLELLPVLRVAAVSPAYRRRAAA